MSIIYDALKKVEESTIQNLKVKTHKDYTSKFKIYLLFILIILAGGIMANIFFGLFTKVSVIKKLPEVSNLSVAEIQTTAQVLPQEPVTTQIDKPPEPTFVLNGVFFSQDEGYALINNQILKLGDMIEGAVVKQITLDEVELETRGSAIKLSTK